MSEFSIVIHRGLEIKAVHRIHAGDTVIGRATNCGIWLTDTMVSRQHAVISNKSQVISIQDLGSRNGVLLNGRPIHRERHIIRDGDQLAIGPYQLIICFSSEKVAELTDVTAGATQSELCISSAIPSAGETDVIRLTPAQLRVYELLLQGLIEKEISHQLGISINTVHHHVKAIYKVMSVSTRGELFAMWVKLQNQPRKEV